MEKQNTKETGVFSSFSEQVNTEQFFPGAQRRNLLDGMKQALSEGVSVLTITGDEGSGKTMMCQMLLREIPREICCVYFPKTLESFDDVVRVLALQIGTAESDEPSSANKLVEDIVAHLQSNSMQLVAVFDEAERMYIATIERIRKMLDLANAEGLLFQVIFAGRRKLLENLKHLAIVEFTSSKEEVFELPLFTLSETYAYLNHVYQLNRGSRANNPFTPSITKKIFSMAKGNLRITNMLAAKSVECSDSETSFMVLLENVSDDIEITRPPLKKAQQPVRKKRYALFAIAFLLGLAAAFGLTRLIRGNSDDAVHTVLPQQETTQPGDAGIADMAENLPVQPERVAEAPGQTDSEQQHGPVPVADDMPAEQTGGATAAVDSAAESSVSALSGADQENVVAEDDRDTGEASAATAQAKTSTVDASGPSAGASAETAQDNVSSASASPEYQTVAEGQKELPAEADFSGPLSVDAEDISPVPPAHIAESPEKQKKKFALPDLPEAAEEKHVSVSELSVEHSAQTGALPAPDTVDTVQFVTAEKKKIYVADNAEQSPVSGKTIAQIAPVKLVHEQVAADESLSDTDLLYRKAVAAGQSWVNEGAAGEYTLQLMVVPVDSAEESLNEKLQNSVYRSYANDLRLLNDESTTRVYLGEFTSLEAAKQMQEDLPSLLKEYDPFVLTIGEAVQKSLPE